MYKCACRCVCACVHKYIWGPEVDIECPPLLIPLLFFYRIKNSHAVLNIEFSGGQEHGGEAEKQGAHANLELCYIIFWEGVSYWASSPPLFQFWMASLSSAPGGNRDMPRHLGISSWVLMLAHQAHYNKAISPAPNVVLKIERGGGGRGRERREE